MSEEVRGIQTDGAMRWSFSVLNTFNDCPLRGKLRYRDGLREPSSEYADLGQAFHSASAFMRVEELEGRGIPSDDELVKRFAEELPSEAFIPRLRDLVTSFRKNFRVPDNPERVWVEERMFFDRHLQTIEPPEGRIAPEAFWLGATDDCSYIRDKVLYVEDDKTGWTTPDPQQIVFYAYLRILREQLSEADVERVVLRYNLIAKGWVDQREMLYSEVVEEGESMLDAILAHEQRTAWPATPGKGCRYCGFLASCPAYTVSTAAIAKAHEDLPAEIEQEGLSAWIRRVAGGIIVDHADASRVVQFRGLVKGLLEQMEDSLAKFITEQGAVEGGGMLARMSTKSEWSGDTKGIVVKLRSLGATADMIWNRLSVSKSDVERMVGDLVPVRFPSQTEEIKAIEDQYPIHFPPLAPEIKAIEAELPLKGVDKDTAAANKEARKTRIDALKAERAELVDENKALRAQAIEQLKSDRAQLVEENKARRVELIDQLIAQGSYKESAPFLAFSKARM
ncbi:MAG: PD-(D/E)XK nuclease family protein [Deltaproteobacteria bacterium]|nr:PD-(D/E)XK nuclease family protein [Deltaproteobacteria bacterium]